LCRGTIEPFGERMSTASRPLSELIQSTFMKCRFGSKRRGIHRVFSVDESVHDLGVAGRNVLLKGHGDFPPDGDPP
jgi:hypothetical protein